MTVVIRMLPFSKRYAHRKCLMGSEPQNGWAGVPAHVWRVRDQALTGYPAPCHPIPCLNLTPHLPVQRTPSEKATPLRHLLLICVDVEVTGPILSMATQRPLDRCDPESRDMKGCRPMHHASTRHRGPHLLRLSGVGTSQSSGRLSCSLSMRRFMKANQSTPRTQHAPSCTAYPSTTI